MKTLTKLPVIGAVWTLMTSGAMLVSTATPAHAEDEVEVLTRGPVHEAFAEAVSMNPEPGIIVRAAPYKAIEELPPEHQPEGDNVTWIPGYWAWDDERDDFLWVSGIWRNVPPERQWIPGYWRDLRDGQYQWTSGYWADITEERATYISEAPPRTLEAGPNMPAPSANHNWVPGAWAWSDAHYIWRPGYWVVSRPNWVWVPARYLWTPHGWVYVSGYWDYVVARRGVLFAPVYYREPIYRTQDYYFTPAIVVAISVFTDHLFVRPRHNHYYFGDYYAPRYRDSGIYASFNWHSSRQGYDPIFAHQTWEHRDDRRWLESRRERFEYFQRHEDARPPHTWTAMRDLRGEQLEEGRNIRFASALDTVVEQPTEGLRFRSLDRDRRQRFVEQNRAIRNFSQERIQVETRAREAAGGTETKEAVTERFARSPVMGRRVEQLKKDEAPPERPEAAVAGVAAPEGEDRARAKEGAPQQDPRELADRQKEEEVRGQAGAQQRQQREARERAERQRQQEERRGQAERDQQQRESRAQAERQRQQEERRGQAERDQQQRESRAQAERQRQQEERRGQAERDQQQPESRAQAERQRQQQEARSQAERAQQQRESRAQAERQRQQQEARGQAERAQQQRESRAQAERQRQQLEARSQAERAQQQQRESRAQAERAQQQQQQRQQQEARAQAERQRQQQQQEARARAERAQQQQQEAKREEQRRSQRRQSEEDEEKRR